MLEDVSMESSFGTEERLVISSAVVKPGGGLSAKMRRELRGNHVTCRYEQNFIHQ
jgi:hypothetical protein